MKINTYQIPAIIPYLLMSSLWVSCLTYSTSGGQFIEISKLNLSLVATGLTCIIISSFFLLKSQSSDRKFVLNRIDFTISIWFIFMTATTWITNRHLDREQYLIFVIGIIFYCCCRLTIYIDRKSVLSAFLLSLGLLTSIESLIAILQFTTFIPSLNNFFTITGTFKNPAPLALFLSSCLPFIYYSFCVVKKGWLKAFFAFDLIISIFVICISGNRASYFALIVIIGYYIISQYHSFFPGFNLRRSRVSRIIGTVIILGILILFTFYLYSLKPASADGRLLIWTISYPQIFEHPIFGGGIGFFKENYSIWQATYFGSNLDSPMLSNTSISSIAGYVRLAYNKYLEIFLEQGLVGLILFLSIFYCSFQFAIPVLMKNHRSISIPIIASLLTILTQSFISYPLHSLPSAVLMFLLLAFLNNEVQISLIKKNIITAQRKPTKILILLALLGLLTLCSGIKRLENYDAYLSARRLFNSNQSYSIQMFASLSDKLSTDPNFLIDYSISLASNNQYNTAIINLIRASKLDGDPQIHILLGDFYTKLKDYDHAEKSYNLASLIVPSLIYPKYALVKLLIIRGKIDDAKIVAKAILNTPVKISSERGDKMLQEMRIFSNSN